MLTNIDPYLFFDGNCAEAMEFYASVLGGKLEIMRNNSAPPGEGPPPGNEERVMHAYLSLGDGKAIMASDTMAGEKYDGMKNVFVSLAYDDTAEAKRIFEALSQGGEPFMPFEKTFWTEGFGMLHDRFGARWMVSGKSLMGAQS